jgi:glycosyltransferase involved in cell wall biosynthesis
MHILIALEKPGEDRPASIRLYVREVCSRLAAEGVRFSETAWDRVPSPDGAGGGFDLVWAPGLGNRRVPLALFAGLAPAVATVHGLQYLTDPPMIRAMGLRRGLGHWLWRRRILGDWRRLRGRIARVITVSGPIRDAVHARLGVEPSRIAVIPHGIGPAFAMAGQAVAEAGGPGEAAPVFHLSQYSSVKNLGRMAEAYARVAAELGRPLRIISAGAPAMALPAGCTLERAPVPHAAVPALMAAAHVFLFPSTEEAFGLPVAEAMAAGVPVVTSKGTGAAEVAGEAAVLVDPLDIASIAGGLRRAACDTDLRARLIAAGRARAARFTWENSAAAHLALFRSLLAGKP